MPTCSGSCGNRPSRWPCRVDFAHSGSEDGTFDLPFDSLQEALDEVSAGGTISIKAYTADKDSPETLTINQAVTINAVNGTVTIGNSAARAAQRGSGEDGFISKKR